MAKKIIFNITIILATYFFPLYVLHLNTDNINIVKSIQNFVAGTIFTGSIFLFYINYINRKKNLTKKWIWLIFEIVGVIGFLYSGFILWLLFIFRNGIGF